MDIGYFVFDPVNPSQKYAFDKSVGSANNSVARKQNYARTQLNTFGKYPYVYYAGKQNFQTFDLSTVFLAQYNETTGVKEKTATQVADEFIDLINMRIPLKVENGQGKVFTCDIQLTNYSTPRLYCEDDYEYVEVTIACTQIDD